jgi:hypothetical protein
MAEKKNNTESKIHGLVILKGNASEDKLSESTYSFEDVDQENKIKLFHELVPYGAAYRYSITIVNESKAPITEIKIKINFPNFLEFTRITPQIINIMHSQSDVSGKQINFEIEELSETTNKLISLFFIPITLNIKGEIDTKITYVNNKDFVRVLNAKSAEINLKSTKIQPKNIQASQISKFLEIKGIKKGIKSFGIASTKKQDVTQFFDQIEQLLKMYKFQLIAKDNTKKIAWFFGTDVESNADILVIGQIVSNKVEFLAASQQHSTVISCLTILANEFKKRLLNIGVVESLDQIYNLICINCGGILDRFPKKGEALECSTCHKSVKIW